MMEKRSELSVITKAKDLCNYILTVTEKSPKRFRFTLVSRLQNYALTIIEWLMMANEIYVKDNREDSLEARKQYQRKAMTYLKLLSYLSLISKEQQCILPKQYEQITKRVYDTRNLLGAWMKSDDKRYGISG